MVLKPTFAVYSVGCYLLLFVDQFTYSWSTPSNALHSLATFMSYTYPTGALDSICPALNKLIILHCLRMFHFVKMHSCGQAGSSPEMIDSETESVQCGSLMMDEGCDVYKSIWEDFLPSLTLASIAPEKSGLAF